MLNVIKCPSPSVREELHSEFREVDSFMCMGTHTHWDLNLAKGNLTSTSLVARDLKWASIQTAIPNWGRAPNADGMAVRKYFLPSEAIDHKATPSC